MIRPVSFLVWEKLIYVETLIGELILCQPFLNSFSIETENKILFFLLCGLELNWQVGWSALAVHLAWEKPGPQHRQAGVGPGSASGHVQPRAMTGGKL